MNEPVTSPHHQAHTPDVDLDTSVSELVRHWARHRGDEIAYRSADHSATWAQYDAYADWIATQLTGDEFGGPVAVFVPDSPDFHAALVGLYRAGRLAVAIGARSGAAEVRSIMQRSGAHTLLMAEWDQRRTPAEFLEELAALDFVPGDTLTVDMRQPIPDVAAISPHTDLFTTTDVSMLNCTSGTTGLPKLVQQTQRRWLAFAERAIANGRLTTAETVAAFVPAPYGFGLWTSHFLPAILGRTALVLPRFDANTANSLLATHRATVLAAVSTQFRMMLRARATPLQDVHSLRVMFTGGEAVPYDDAREFEEVTGAKVLQFYGSNETGAASATCVDDPDDVRLRSGGRVLPEMRVRILETEGGTGGGGVQRGQPAVNGPLMSPGYWNDDPANAELFTTDGWMLLGDVVELSADGIVSVVGRLADLVIRGGKNISAVEVEDAIRPHPSVEMVAVVGVPDQVLGERVCAAITLAPGYSELTLDELTTWMRASSITRELLPEKLVILDEMPIAPGGKIAKSTVAEVAMEK